MPGKLQLPNLSGLFAAIGLPSLALPALALPESLPSLAAAPSKFAALKTTVALASSCFVVASGLRR